MGDNVDRAQEREQLMRDVALEAHRRRPRPTGQSPHVCTSCEGEIEETRRFEVPGTNVCAWCAGQIARG